MLKLCTVYNAFVVIEREKKVTVTDIQKQAPCNYDNGLMYIDTHT